MSWKGNTEGVTGPQTLNLITFNKLNKNSTSLSSSVETAGCKTLDDILRPDVFTGRWPAPVCTFIFEHNPTLMLPLVTCFNKGWGGYTNNHLWLAFWGVKNNILFLTQIYYTTSIQKFEFGKFFFFFFSPTHCSILDRIWQGETKVCQSFRLRQGSHLLRGDGRIVQGEERTRGCGWR